MRVLMIAHIGETLGHLVRGLAIAEELSIRGIEVEFAASSKGEWLLKASERAYTHHKIRWNWSHNSCDPDIPSSDFLQRVVQSASDVMSLLTNRYFDLIVGLPGVVTTQVARDLGIPHVSILHAPYLSPIIHLKEATPIESAVLKFGKRVFSGGCVDIILSHLSQALGIPQLTYETYLKTEPIFVPQPGLNLPDRPNIRQSHFIRASIGPPLDCRKIDLKEACYVTFGSGNPCDISKIVELTRTVFPLVIVSTGRIKLQSVPERVITKPFIASSSLAGGVAAVISHGGIGTVGTFAEYGTPQLIIPTELDQATMAVHAARLGFAKHCGLNSWVRRGRLGRSLTEFPEDEFISVLHTLRSMPIGSKKIVSSGASDIASALAHDFVLADLGVDSAHRPELFMLPKAFLESKVWSFR